MKKSLSERDICTKFITPAVEEDHGDPAELLAKLEKSEAETAKLRDRLKAILEEALLR